jgi:hypothetical protein
MAVSLDIGADDLRGQRYNRSWRTRVFSRGPPASASSALSRDRLVASNVLVREHGDAFAHQRMIVNAEDGDAV